MRVVPSGSPSTDLPGDKLNQSTQNLRQARDGHTLRSASVLRLGITALAAAVSMGYSLGTPSKCRQMSFCKPSIFRCGRRWTKLHSRLYRWLEGFCLTPFRLLPSLHNRPHRASENAAPIHHSPGTRTKWLLEQPGASRTKSCQTGRS